MPDEQMPNESHTSTLCVCRCSEFGVYAMWRDYNTHLRDQIQDLLNAIAVLSVGGMAFLSCASYMKWMSTFDIFVMSDYLLIVASAPLLYAIFVPIMTYPFWDPYYVSSWERAFVALVCIVRCKNPKHGVLYPYDPFLKQCVYAVIVMAWSFGVRWWRAAFLRSLFN